MFRVLRLAGDEIRSEQQQKEEEQEEKHSCRFVLVAFTRAEVVPGSGSVRHRPGGADASFFHR